MSLKSRIFRLIRANVSHAVRNLGGEDDDPFADLDLDAIRAQAEAEAAEEAPRRPVRPDARARLEKAYRALDLPFGAGPEAIKQAHRKLLRKYHPDRFARDETKLADATRLAQEFTLARDALLDAIEKGELTPTSA